MLKRFRPLPLAALVLVAPLGAAQRVQSPDARWRTIPTAHYRINYPDTPEFTAFAQEVAGKIEGIHALLEKEVGHALPGPTDVLIQNPLALTNGLTQPILNRPLVILFTEPLESDWEISHESDWVELLLLHELVHLHHLTWPDRQPRVWDRLQALRLTRLTQQAPAWIHEGYATLLEGKLTGSGRPHGAYRAMVLRLRALAGRLPTYQAICTGSADPATQSGTHYIFGSAFLDWLESHHRDNPTILQDLWKRLASRRYRTFRDAFQATFGDDPESLFNRFRAELTHTALEQERRTTAAGLREGELWHQVDRGFLKGLSVSPDGSRLLANVRQPKTSGLTIWKLDAPLEAANDREKGKAKDPSLPEAVGDLRPIRQIEHLLPPPGFLPVDRPRWDADGTVPYETWRADAEGVFHRKETTWHPVSLPSVPLHVAQLYPLMQDKAWAIQLEGRAIRVPLEPFGPLAWDQRGKVVYASTPVDGIYNLVRMAFDPASPDPFGPPEVLTRTLGGAAYPAPSPDGKTLWFGLLTAHGTQIRRLDLGLSPLQVAKIEQDSAPFAPGTTLSHADEPDRVPPAAPCPPSRPYGVGDSHLMGLRQGFVFTPSARALFFGLGGNDVLGRVDWIAQAALPLWSGAGGAGPRGGMAGVAWRGWAWAPSMHVYSSLEKPSDQTFLQVQGYDAERRGVEVALTREWMGWPQVGRITLQAGTQRMDRLNGTTRNLGLGGLSFRQHVGWAGYHWDLSGQVDGQAQRRWSEGAQMSLGRAKIGLSATFHGWDLSVEAEQGRMNGLASSLEAFHLGGLSTGIQPGSFEATLVAQPSLPTFSATGDRFERWRIGSTGFYVEGVGVWNGAAPRPSFTRIAGLELKGSLEDIPILREIIQRYLGRPEYQLGLARPLDGPMKDRTVFTLAILNRF